MNYKAIVRGMFFAFCVPPLTTFSAPPFTSLESCCNTAVNGGENPLPHGRGSVLQQLLGEVIPDDPDFVLQWGLHNTGQTVDGKAGMVGADVDAPGAWEIHRGTSSVVVAIVGRGIDPHPEFADRLLEGRAVVGDLFDTLDTCPHDTHLAGIIAAATGNGEGIAGLAGEVRILPVRVLEGCGGTPAAAAEGIVWAVDHDADVILVPIHFSAGSEALQNAVVYAVDHDVVVIASVGNAGSSDLVYPAAYEGCLAVSATTNQDQRSGVSNYGPHVDLSAPGSGIWSTWTDGSYAYQPPDRDSAPASAFVAGVAALLRSYAPQLSASQVTRILMDSADDLGDPGWDMYFGAGRVNARRALETAPRPALRFEYVDFPPAAIPPDMTSSFAIRIAGVAEAVAVDSAMLFYRTNSPDFTSAPLRQLDDDMYVVELPAAPCGSSIEYFLLAEGRGGTVVTDPLEAPDRLHSAQAVRYTLLFEDDFEEDRGWEVVVEGDEPATGAWERVIPIGTSAQPGFDYSPDAGRYCYVTGQHHGGSDGRNDVDGGPVRLISPVVALSGDDAEVSYAFWFYWSEGVGEEDFLTVEFSRDGGTDWTTVEIVQSTGQWLAHSFRLSEFPGAVGDQLRVRFSTADSPSDSLTEAAVDEFRVRAIRCAVGRGDVNYDGLIDRLDFALMLDCWTGASGHFLDSSCDALDFDRNRRIDLADYQPFQKQFGTNGVD